MLISLLLCLAPVLGAAAQGMRISPHSEQDPRAPTHWPQTSQWSYDLPSVSRTLKHATFYQDWLSEFSATRSDPDTTLHNRLRELHPDHTITTVSQPTFQLLEYASVADHGLSIRKRPDTEAISKQVYIPAARRREGTGSISVSIKFSAFDLHWQVEDTSETFLAYYGTWAEGYQTIQQWWLLQPSKAESASAADLLIHAVSHYAVQLHKELWEFSYPGFWKKSKSLYEAIEKTGNWEDIILDETLKRDLKEDVIGFYAKEELYKGLSVPWKRGVILMGEPGNGKTITLKALQHQLLHETDVVPLYVKTFSQYGSDEAGIHEIFKHARAVSPCLLIIEDLDSLITDINRSNFLNELDGLEDNDGIFVLATTNYFEKLDPSISARPSRFDRKYSFPAPETKERRAYGVYWQHKLRDRSDLGFDNALLDQFALETKGFSFAYLKEVFVSTLLLIAGGDKASFSELLIAQVHSLGKQLNETSVASPPKPLRMQSSQFTFGQRV